MTTAQLKAQAEWLSAFGEPTRLNIVRALATGVKTVTELARAAKTEVVNVSHHLSVMKAAGVVKCDRDGRFMRYSLFGAKATAVAIEITHESGARVTPVLCTTEFHVATLDFCAWRRR